MAAWVEKTIVYLVVLFSLVHSKPPDWMVTKVAIPTTLTKTESGTILLSNGLISREFSVSPDFTTVDYYSHDKESSLLRALSPEAVVSLDNVRYNVGGLVTSIPRAFMNRTALDQDKKQDENAFHFVSYSVQKPQAPFPYRPKRGAPSDIVWPPKGLRLDVTFQAPKNASGHHKKVTIKVHYEMYDGIPLMSKWISASVSPDIIGKVSVSVNSVEYLALNMEWAALRIAVSLSDTLKYGWLYIDTDQSHGTRINWQIDEEAHKLLPGSFQPNLNCSYETSFSVLITKETFISFRAHVLAVGSNDFERHHLAQHRMFRLLAPHTQENPIFFHMTNYSQDAVVNVIDQLATVGFEMMIYSFGTGHIDMESNSTKLMGQVKKTVDYANSKGIEVGAYDLIVLSRKVKPEWMTLKPDSNETYGSACLASGWYDYLFGRLTTFMEKTGLTMVETDGPYGGTPCASTHHAYHKGFQDSIYQQTVLQGKFYTYLREKEIYINQPDMYFYQGGSKTGLGYNEHQFSLPRWLDIDISRQTIYDRTFTKTVTSGWMFVPIKQYHAGGSAAMFMPLSEHKLEYEWALAQYLGAGIAACYRGPFIYDSEETKQIVIKWVSFYKKYRDILTSDMVHIRRPDMQSIDSYMHVNPFIKNKGLAMVFNPTMRHITMNLTLPLYFTGLTDVANISEQGKTFKQYKIGKDYKVDVLVDIQARNITWFLIQ